MSSVLTQPEKIKLILEKSAQYFGVTVDELTRKQVKKGKVSPHKKLVIPILFDNTNLTGVKIGELMGYRDHVTANHHYRNMRDELSDETYGNERTKKLYKELVQFIGI